MAGKGRAEFDASPIIISLEKGHARSRPYLAQVTKYYALQSESWARVTARWNDQTGNARQGLVGTAQTSGDQFGITLSHSVNYGIWLEVRFGGRYAIIRPTLEHIAPDYMRDASRLFGRMYG